MIPRPWKTPEGTVNRPVLRMMTEGVLLHIMCNPGITLQSLYNKYHNILQPMQVRELVEVGSLYACCNPGITLQSLYKTYNSIKYNQYKKNVYFNININNSQKFSTKC